jgi:hypothetical protein
MSRFPDSLGSIRMWPAVAEFLVSADPVTLIAATHTRSRADRDRSDSHGFFMRVTPI